MDYKHRMKIVFICDYIFSNTPKIPRVIHYLFDPRFDWVFIWGLIKKRYTLWSPSCHSQFEIRPYSRTRHGKLQKIKSHLNHRLTSSMKSKRLKNGPWNVPAFHKILYFSAFLAAVIPGMLPSYFYHMLKMDLNLICKLNCANWATSFQPHRITFAIEKDFVLHSKPR